MTTESGMIMPPWKYVPSVSSAALCLVHGLPDCDHPPIPVPLPVALDQLVIDQDAE